MHRLLSLLMVVILVVSNGSAVAGAVCRHESPAIHNAARGSDDARISGAALQEEAADSAASKKAALAYAGALIWAGHLASGPQLTVPFDASRALDPYMAHVQPLAGRSPAPLLEPPAA